MTLEAGGARVPEDEYHRHPLPDPPSVLRARGDVETLVASHPRLRVSQPPDAVHATPPPPPNISFATDGVWVGTHRLQCPHVEQLAAVRDRGPWASMTVSIRQLGLRKNRFGASALMMPWER
jgi:hypothetical protein